MSRRIRRPSFLPTQLPLIIEEFDHNRPRSEAAVTTSVLDRLRQLRWELREYAGDKHEHIWLAETAQHIPLVNTTAPQNFREIDELLPAGTILEPSEPDYARAVQRGLGKRAPFTSDKNSVADALLIEIYASQISYEAALSRVCTSCAWFVPGLTVCGGSRRRSEGVPGLALWPWIAARSREPAAGVQGRGALAQRRRRRP